MECDSPYPHSTRAIFHRSIDNSSELQYGHVMSNNNLFPTLSRWAILTVLVAAGLLFVAGTTRLPMLNAYIVALAPSLLVMMLAIAPRIAQERGSADDRKDLRDRSARLALVV